MERVWDVVNIAMQTSTPIILWGEPGVGKTEIIRQMAEQNGYHVETVIASTRQPSDLVGLPINTEDGVKFSPPDWAVRANSHKKAIVFFDELSTAPPSVQAAVLRIFSEKMVDSYQLHGGISLVAAANPVECSAGGWELAPPMANRMMHVSIQPDLDDWVEWMVSGGKSSKKNWEKVPRDWQNLLHETRSLIAGYMQVKRNDLQKLPSDSQAGRAWPSPRTWYMASKMLAAVRAINGDLDLQNLAVAACVGGANAQEFHSWVKNLDLPKPEEILKDHKKHMPDKVLKRADLLYVILSSLTSHTLSFKDKKKYKDVWLKALGVFDYVKNKGYKDVALTFVAPLARNIPAGGGLSSVPEILCEFGEFMTEASQVA